MATLREKYGNNYDVMSNYTPDPTLGQGGVNELLEGYRSGNFGTDVLQQYYPSVMPQLGNWDTMQHYGNKAYDWAFNPREINGLPAPSRFAMASDVLGKVGSFADAVSRWNLAKVGTRQIKEGIKTTQANRALTLASAQRQFDKDAAKALSAQGYQGDLSAKAKEMGKQAYAEYGLPRV
jgi:hypothetical protein